MIKTTHALERVYALTPAVGPRAFRRLDDEIARHKDLRGDVAVCIRIPPTKNPLGRTHSRCDLLVALIRGGRVTSYMLSRSQQKDPAHFRVQRVIF